MRQLETHQIDGGEGHEPGNTRKGAAHKLPRPFLGPDVTNYAAQPWSAPVSASRGSCMGFAMGGSGFESPRGCWQAACPGMRRVGI